MITTVKIVRAHVKALYWKNRVEKAEQQMRKNLDVLSSLGSGKWETEHGFFTVTENNTYPETAIREQLTETEQASCMELRWSNARAKVLFPIQHAKAKVHKGYKVSI